MIKIKKKFPHGLCVKLAILLLTLSTPLAWPPLLALCSAALSLFTLGLPAAFQRSQAMSLSPGRIRFDHIVSLLLCAAGTAELYFLIGRSTYLAFVIPRALPLCAALLMNDLAQIHLQALRKNGLALLLDALAAAFLFIGGWVGGSLDILAAAVLLPALAGTILSLRSSGRRAFVPGNGLLRELPGGLFEELYYPLIAAFALLLRLRGTSLAEMTVLNRLNVAGFAAGQLLLTAYRPAFRREEEERSFARPLLALIALALSALMAALEEGRLAPALGCVSLAAGCAFTLYEAATLPNIISELALIALGVALMAADSQVFWLPWAAVGASLLALLAQWRTVSDFLRLQRLKKRQ